MHGGVSTRVGRAAAGGEGAKAAHALSAITLASLFRAHHFGISPPPRAQPRGLWQATSADLYLPDEKATEELVAAVREGAPECA